MPEPDDFRTRQLEFAAHIRDPGQAPAPADVEDRRMAIYRDLFFNNVRKLLAGTFPILSAILGEERWALLVRDFYRDHQSHSPLFPDVPREFLHYLVEERPQGRKTDTEADLPFASDLAHYEWVEAGLLLAADPDPDMQLNCDGDLLKEAPVVSELAWLLRYDWPVHEIGVDHLPEQRLDEPVYFLVYRNAADNVKFVRLNAISARLMELVRDNQGASGRELLERLTEELNHPNADKVIASGASILEQWRALDIIMGTRPI